MKRISIISLFSLVLSACMLTTSCDDMLTPDMDRYAKEDKFGQDSIYSALGVLRSIQRVAERTIILDASRSDMVKGGAYTTDSINDLVNFNNPQDGSSALCNVADYYHIVNSCNFYLANVDTTITVNGKKEMLKEWAQVQSMRAWAYIQLVRNYGEVPFVTVPVGSTSEADKIAATTGKANASNLASLLVKNGLQYAYAIQYAEGMPNYGTFNNGMSSYSSQENLFPVELMLADAYLMANDYANAANYYYQYFRYNCSATPTFNNWQTFRCAYTTMSMTGRDDETYVNSGSASNIFDGSSLEDNIICATSATTPATGQTLTQIQNVFGFKTTISGTSIYGEPNEQYAQLVPSNQYLTTSTAQRYNAYTIEGEVVKMEGIEPGDGRFIAFAPKFRLRGGSKERLVGKFMNVGIPNNSDNSNLSLSRASINYFIQLYRLPVAVLRYAEAVNRLGFPELAFGILKDGLIQQNLPEYGTLDVVKSDRKFVKIYDTTDGSLIRTDTVPGIVVGKLNNDGQSAKADYTVDSTTLVFGDKYVGNFIPNEPNDSIKGTALSEIPEDVQNSWRDVEYLLNPKAFTGGMYYLSMEEAKAMTQYPFLNFSDAIWSVETSVNEATDAGIHSRGSGMCAGRYDTVYTYAKQVAEKLAEEYARQNNLSYAEQKAYAKTLYNGDELLVTDKEAIKNAVENIIVDELALETAFEGNRYGDLIRIAGHKNEAGYNGTDWFAWKIARRNNNFTDNAALFDASLKAKLLNKSNWYLSLPK